MKPFEKPALCIDLGASFTKVAVRPGPDSDSELLRDFQLMTKQGEEDNQYCFPSVVAHHVRSGKWAFGWEASAYKPSPDILILQDWKSVLFHKKYLEEFFDPEVDGQVDPVELFLRHRDPYYIALACARNYLKWLYDEHIPYLLRQHPLLAGADLCKMETRVCVPDFVMGTGAGKTIDRLMGEAGFENSGEFCISEPRASLLGILTEGRNCLDREGRINTAAMFGDHLLLEKLSQGDSMLFLDIGSFTTDLALARFSLGRCHSPAVSYPLGIYQLDSMILHDLPKHCGARVDLNNLPDTDRFHRTVYHHDQKRTRFARNEAVLFPDGTEVPQRLIDAPLEKFSRSILSACDTFLTLHRRGAPNGRILAVVLTGGGSLPSRISDRVIRGLEPMGFPLLRAHRGIGETSLPVDSLSQHLVRGASAIGGASIFYCAYANAGEGEAAAANTGAGFVNLLTARQR